MKTVILDSYALLAYFEQEPGWKSIAGLLAESAEAKAYLLLSVVNWGEVSYIIQRTYGEKQAEEVLMAIDELPMQIMAVNREHTVEAARLKACGGLSYADCFAVGLAIVEGGTVATGAPEFKAVEPEVDILWVPGPDEASSDKALPGGKKK